MLNLISCAGSFSLNLVKVCDFSFSKNPRGLTLSAASGLVSKNDFLFMVADDELSLASISLKSLNTPDATHWTELLLGDLPLDSDRRKNEKPDFESLVLCEPSKQNPLGALLCLPSGSRSQRMTGVLLPFKDHEDQFAEPQIFDLTPLYKMLFSTLGLLNIEGGLFLNDELILFHRGNLKDPKNWAIHLKAQHFLNEIANDNRVSAKVFSRFQEINLGQISGVPLGVTDACRISETTIGLLAAAEATGDPYTDAVCVGSAFCLLDLNLNVLKVVPLNPSMKAEGLAIGPTPGDFFVVTDPDDRKIASTLYQGEIPCFARA